MRDELRILRERVEAVEQALDAIEQPDGSPGLAVAAITVNGGSYPVTGGGLKTYLLTATDVSGANTEGGTATATTRSGTFYGVNILTGLPTAGTAVLATMTSNGTWVFEHA